MKACLNGHAKVANAILEFRAGEEKAEIDAVAHDGWTAAHAAARRGDLETINVLHKGGADFSIRDKSKFGDTPLLVACFHAEAKVVEALLGAGVDWRETDVMGNNALHKICISSEGEHVDRDNLVHTIMHYDGLWQTASGKVPLPSASHYHEGIFADNRTSLYAVTE